MVKIFTIIEKQVYKKVTHFGGQISEDLGALWRLRAEAEIQKLAGLQLFAVVRKFRIAQNSSGAPTSPTVLRAV